MPRVDWSFGPGKHPVVGAVLAGASALSVTMVAFLVGLEPWWWPAVAGTTVGLAAAAMAGWQDMPGAAVLYRAVCWIAAGGWSTWTLAVPDGGPWSRWPLLTLATGTAVAAVVGTAMARMEERERRAKPQPSQPAVAVPRDPVAAEWQERIQRITRIEVAVTKAVPWSPPTGFTLHVVLPDDGTRAQDLKDYEGPLGANLPVGCNVEVLPPSRTRRLVLIRVATENAMAETHHLPDDVSPLTINDPLPVGIHADRTLGSVNLRYSSGVLVGQKGSGKSNILNVITHQLVRCTDTVVWAIDLSGNGRYPRPWIRPWFEGQCDVPAIDWAAVTPEDAELMCLAAINVINGRTAAYQQLMHDANDDKIPASPQVPQIVILVDEIGTLPDAVKDHLATISDTGRGAAVQDLACGLRANASYIPRDMIVQARERLAMRVTDEAELQYLFDTMWSRGRFDPASIPYEGSGLLATGAVPPAPFKAWRAEPNRITGAAIAVARLRPALDDISVELADTVGRQYRDEYGQWATQEITGAYAQRWERTLPLMFPAASRSAATRSQTAAAAGTTTVAPPATEQREEPSVNPLEESARDLQQAAERARRAAQAADAEAQAEQDDPDWSVVEGWLAEGKGGGDRPKPPARVRMWQIVQEHRRDGIGPRAVWQQLREEGYPTAEPTVIGWMRRDAERGILAQPGGDKTPYTVGPDFTLDPE